ncbi:hypothetical protein ACLX1H_009334 [Fusarium chlamydosporum]
MGEQGACLLLRLSTELLYQIIDYSHPSTTLAFALTCSTLHRQCQPLLEQHRDAYNKYRITSDLSPETVIDLLKDTTTAKIERWHVRELEIWGSRENWQDWRSWAPELPGEYGLAVEDPSRVLLVTREVQRYIRSGIDWWDYFRHKIEEVQQDLQSGCDAYLKLLLIVSCPRLHSIRFVKRKHDTWKSLKCMTEAIRWSRQELNGQWPPGFESLRSVAVGISTDSPCHRGEGGDDDDEEEEESGMQNVSNFVELLYLPHIKDIYFSDLYQDKEEEQDADFHFEEAYFFPTGTSSVESIFLDRASNLSTNVYFGIAGASKHLETIIIRAPDMEGESLDNVDTLMHDLTKEAPQLQRLIIYNSKGMRAYRCALYYPEVIRNAWVMKQITVASSDIELECSWVTEGKIDSEELDLWIEEAFSPSIEAMYVCGMSAGYMDDSEEEIPTKSLDLLLAKLIESGAYENLQVIYVESVERGHGQLEWEIMSGKPIDAGLKELAFQETVAAGQKAGVHVCTLMNRDDGGYWKNFPARPDRFDLKTGPWAGKRPADWKLNLDSGEWGPDCRGCGECKECLVVYPSELWKNNKIATA